MLEKLKSIFKIRELRVNILIILFVLLAYRMFANIPVPGVDISQIRQFFEGNQFLGFLNVFSGGGLQNLSVMMLGVGPYITAIIILQLLTLVIPRLKEMYTEEGEVGRKQFEQYARIITVPLSALQAFSMLSLFQKQGIITLTHTVLLVAIVSITAGSMLLMWMGELITERKLGNGVSFLILAGIIATVPTSLRQVVASYDPSQIFSYAIYFLISLIVILGVVYINEARRNIPVNYARRVRGRKMYGGVSTVLPLSLNPAGVIPIIFAMSVMLIPGMFASVFSSVKVAWLANMFTSISHFFNNTLYYNIFYFILIFGFTYLYTAITFEPKKIAESLQKMGGFVPGVRPGKSTSDYLTHILNRTLFVGGLCLGIVAVLPNIVQGLTNITGFGFAVGGTSLLIVVSVILETRRQIEGQLELHRYDI